MLLARKNRNLLALLSTAERNRAIKAWIIFFIIKYNNYYNIITLKYKYKYVNIIFVLPNNVTIFELKYLKIYSFQAIIEINHLKFNFSYYISWFKQTVFQ